MKRRALAMIMAVAILAATFVVPVGAFAASKIQILKVTVDHARVRKGPSSAYDVKTSLKKGSKVFYLGKIKNSFAYVRSSTGTSGYMYKGYLKSYGKCYKSQVYYTKQKASMYKKASTSSKRLRKLSKKEHVIVYQVKGKWAYVKTMGGKGGYMKKSYLKKVDW